MFVLYTKRILAMPFIFGLLFITHMFFIFKRTGSYLRYGGEYVQYGKDERKTMTDIYELLKEQYGKIH